MSTERQNSSEQKSAADIIIVLDESGSMEKMGKEPSQAMNLFIKEQQSVCGDSLFTLYTFATKSRTIYKNVPLGTIKEYKDYIPGGTTALYDTIKQAITEKMSSDENRHRNVVLVIITDGEDNSSLTTKSEINILINKQENDYNWQVLFLAANQDAFRSGGNYGCKRAKCANFNQACGSLIDLMRQTSGPVMDYRASSLQVDLPREIDLIHAVSDPVTGNEQQQARNQAVPLRPPIPSQTSYN